MTARLLTSLLPLLALLALALPIAETQAQSGTMFNQRDDKYRLLGLKRAKEAYEVARAEYDRQKELFDKKMVTQADLDRTKANMSDAEVNYQQSLLAVLFEQQYVTISAAVKYYAHDGTRHVRLTVANASGGTAEFDKLINIDDKLFRSLQPDIINNVYISLLNDESSIISQPYESKIPQLIFNQPATLDFKLLQDLDAVTVSIIYGSGTQRNMKIYLQKDVSTNKVAVQSEQFSQEVDLGKTASYDLGLELFSGTSNTFSLEVINLPTQVSRTFKDPTSGARLSQVKFSETTRSKRASLEVTMPDRPSDVIAIDKPIPFFVVILPPDRSGILGADPAKVWTQEELDKLDVGYVKLELMPRGKGMLLVRSNQLFQTIKGDETARIEMGLVNEGSNRLDNIEFQFDLPLNWRKQIDPSVISSLNISQDTIVKMAFTPPENVSAGRYDIRVRTTGQSNGQPVSGEDKTVTIEIQASSSVIGTIIIVILIVGLVGGIVIFGIRLSRK
ncbi:MAG: NEW3 domain-containing protein [Candidatus Zixiibacteriota bacterium]